METTDIRIGNGYDVHALGEGIQMRLCGIDIPHTHGFIAHSDGDVAIHALCDAILGALAMGDIGRHFPDNSDEYKGIDSRILLSRVVALAKGRGYKLNNADITIALQAPKLAAYIPLMRESLSQICECEPDRISVKATTTEKLGFVGRREGCEVWATVLLVK
ncbi:MAG: 2-C-methyl-D-erythritol 2,4-cyclodiphosphate synthase [Candidatus Cryptobacteroides sp.]